MELNEIIISHVSASFKAELDKGAYFEMSHRKSYGLSFAVEGEVVYTLNGKNICSHTNNLVLLPKAQSYSLRCTESGHFPVINFEIANTRSISQIIAFPTTSNAELLPLFLTLEASQRKTSKQKRFQQLALLYQIFSHVIIPPAKNKKSPKRALLQPAIEYLESHFDDPQLNNTSLAQKSFLSEVHFRNLFRDELGTTPKQYIQQFRINKAKELLECHFFSITQVAEMVGYSSIYHFSKVFKTTTGYTPSEYKGLAETPEKSTFRNWPLSLLK